MNPSMFCDLMFEHMPCGAVTCELVYDTDGTLRDFTVTKINGFLRGFLGFETERWIGKPASGYVPHGTFVVWTERFALAARENAVGHYLEYAETLKRRCSVTICPFDPRSCTVMFIMY